MITLTALLAIMAVLAIAAHLTRPRDDTPTNLARAEMNVLLRIGVFLTGYITSLVIAIFLIPLAFRLTSLLFDDSISLGKICLAGCLWITILIIIFALVKPLFQFSSKRDDLRTELSRTDAPELFDLIETTAGEVGVEIPRKVYINSTAIVKTDFIAPFRSIFFPKGRSLTIGLGLLYGLNRSEFKSVLAHAFGNISRHMTGLRMLVNLGHTLTENIANRRDWIDDNVKSWGWFGVIIYCPLQLMRLGFKKLYYYVQKGVCVLYQLQEYDSDEVSADTVGNETFISMLCKSEVIRSRLEIYEQALSGISEGKFIIPPTYWDGFEMLLSLSNEIDGINLSPTMTATAPLIDTPTSRVSIKNPWFTHPSLEKRIAKIRKIDRSRRRIERAMESAQTMVAAEAYVAVSDLRFAGYDISWYKRMDTEHFNSELTHHLRERMFAVELRPFFNRNISHFNIIDEAAANPPSYSPLTKEHARFLLRFEQEKKDLSLLESFINNHYSIHKIGFDGEVYNRHNVPINTQRDRVNNLVMEAKRIDCLVYRYALSRAAKPAIIEQAYNDVMYAQFIILRIRQELNAERDNIYAILKRMAGEDTSDYERREMQKRLVDYAAKIRGFISRAETKRLEPVLHVDMARHLMDFMNGSNIFSADTSSYDEIYNVFVIPDELIDLFENLAYFSKKIISDSLMERAPLMFWEGSVAAGQRADQAVEAVEV